MSEPTTDIQQRMNDAQEVPNFGQETTEGSFADPESAIVTEEKKPVNRSTIVTFVIIVLGIGGVWFMHQRTGGPKSAQAASANAAQAEQTVNSFLQGGEANIRVMETMLRNTQKVVEQFLNYPSMTQVPLIDLKTNPFRAKAPTLGGSGEELSEAGEKKKREEERLAALKAVQDLQLQSIMYGENRKACMINGALYTEGQQVETFTVEKINQSSVVVKMHSFRFELRMQR